MGRKPPPRGKLACPGQILALAVAYTVLARLGLAFDPLNSYATFVWAPSGLSLAALILGGYRLWPGIAIGALAINLWMGAPPLVACGVAAGDVIEALVGAFALRSLPGFRASLDRFADVVGLVALAVLMSTAVGATIGAASVVLGGVVGRGHFFPIWRTWWAGDVIGDLLVAPLVLTWACRSRAPLRPAQIVEGVALGALPGAQATVCFSQRIEVVVALPLLQPSLLFLPLIWAALRFGARGAATGMLLVAVPAIWGTFTGHGIFVRATHPASLAALDVALGNLALATLALGSVVDARERSRRELRESDERHRLAVEAAHLGTWCWEVKTTRLVWTPLCREMHGVGPDEEVCFQRFLAALHPDDRDRTKRAIERAVVEQIEYRIEHRVMLPDGGVRWLSAFGRTYGEEAGGPDRMRGVVMDVTSQKRAEDERLQLLDRERAARAEAQAATRAKDAFLAVLSHELRTPLQAMLGWTRMLREPGCDAPKLARGLCIIERNVATQAQLIEDLLDVSRIASGKLRVERTRVALDEVVGAAIESARAAASARSILLDATLTTRDVEVLGDPGRLGQVISNLLTNAVKFTPAGGRVGVRLERVDTCARIVVEDTGRGISADFLPYVFDRFRQQDEHASSCSSGGLGLGLAIVHHLVEAHGGTIVAASPGEGRGATFTVTLPLADAAPGALLRS